ncbi:VOC family protein [Bacillus carboniphilus]|uniref:VOC family protein n=1 Tax=Bacillus carboniphilus TaxID=86663 RepID=A0ABY9JSL1_9BACI|nr:VOC family protein [Bacillus carboniphilus]WLR42384.1 VOC family protein [Bacillus carboniphilus]
MKQQITPYLCFNGNAEQALQFYKKIFGGEVLEIQTFGEADFPTPPEAKNRILHAKFKKDQLLFMVSDSFPGKEVEIGSNISLVLEFDEKQEIEKTYKLLSEKGTIIMELQDTFWDACYAKVKDAFGVTWDLNHSYNKK